MKTNGLTIAKALATYLESERIRLKQSTYAVYERHLANHIAPSIGKLKVADVTNDDTQAFAGELLNGLAVTTVKSVISFLKCGLAESVPAGTFKVKLPKEELKPAFVLSRGQQKRLEEAAKNGEEAIYLAVILCLYLGLRVGEVCGLKWSDIDIENKCVHIKRTIQRIKNPDKGGKKTKIVFQTPKSRASLRTIPLPAFILSVLKAASLSGEYVLNKNGKFIEPRTVQNRFKKVLKAAGLDDVNFHTLRHTFATRALESGFDPKTLSEVMGHSNPTITMNRYAHCLNEHKRKTMELLSIFWDSGKISKRGRLKA
jgi:integrase